MSLPDNSFDGILLSRLLIFLSSEEIENALTQAYRALKIKGRLYILSPSPLRKKWEALLPIFQSQQEEGILWPGQIENLWDLLPSEKENLPNTIQLIDPPSLHKGLKRAGFKVESCSYYCQETPQGEEKDSLTGAIGLKP